MKLLLVFVMVSAALASDLSDYPGDWTFASPYVATPDDPGSPRGDGLSVDKVRVFNRKEYLDEETLNRYIARPRGGFDIASEAAFRYLNYEVTISTVFDIPFEDSAARARALEELRWKRERAVLWADEVLAKAPDERDAYIILILKAEMLHEREMEAAVDRFERLTAARESAEEPGETAYAEEPLIRCDGSRATLEKVVANCPDPGLVTYAKYFLGFIAEEEGRLDKARYWYADAYKTARERAYYQGICFRLGELSLLSGDYETAISYYGEVPPGSDYYGVALYGLCFAEYARAQATGDVKGYGKALDYYVKLASEVKHTPVTEHCSRTAAASLFAFAGEDAPPNAHTVLEEFDRRLSARLGDRAAATLLRSIAGLFDSARGDYAEAIVVYVALLDRYPGYEDTNLVIDEISRVFCADPEREVWYRRLFLAKYGRGTDFYNGADEVTRLAVDRLGGD